MRSLSLFGTGVLSRSTSLKIRTAVSMVTTTLALREGLHPPSIVRGVKIAWMTDRNVVESTFGVSEELAASLTSPPNLPVLECNSFGRFVNRVVVNIV
jgi:hypothetical protein